MVEGTISQLCVTLQLRASRRLTEASTPQSRLSNGEVVSVKDQASPGGQRSDYDAWLYALHSRMNKEVKSQMLIDGKRVLFQLDTGASVNTPPRELVGDATMKPYHGRLRRWTNDTLKPAGTCRKLITNPKNGKQYDLRFIVLDDAEYTLLLSLDTCKRMNLRGITVNEEEFDAVRVLRKAQEDYRDVFDAKQPGKATWKTTPHRRPNHQASGHAKRTSFSCDQSKAWEEA